MNAQHIIRWLLVLSLVIGAAVVMAQEPRPIEDISADEVNAIAKDLYCPVCENIPLDTCGTAACEDWRYEIRLQLADGATEQEIVDDFISRFGERVVGTPQDPVLRAMSLVTPWVLVGGLIFAVVTMIRGKDKPKPAAPVVSVSSEAVSDDDYRNMLENDLRGDA